ncbi:MAG: hypothetical protein ACRCZF_12245 [Gemmataceae bacterium]
MAQMTILLRQDPVTRKQNIIVKLDSEPDALPIEHEQLHRKLVEKLVSAGMKIEDLGHIEIEREAPRSIGAEPASTENTPVAKPQGSGRSA